MKKLVLLLLVNGFLLFVTLLYEAFDYRPASPTLHHARESSRTKIHLRQANEVRLCVTALITCSLCEYATSR